MLSEKDYIQLKEEFAGNNVFIEKENFNTWGGRVKLKDFCQNGKENFDFICIQPWINAIINSDGNLCVCNNQEDDNFGNVIEQDLFKLWNSKKLVDLRKNMLDGKKLDIKMCSNCSYNEYPKIFQQEIGRSPYKTLLKYILSKK
jgi:radical SAM protein with 4Fe4S-binding SPASM domain